MHTATLCLSCPCVPTGDEDLSFEAESPLAPPAELLERPPGYHWLPQASEFGSESPWALEHFPLCLGWGMSASGWFLWQGQGGGPSAQELLVVPTS